VEAFERRRPGLSGWTPEVESSLRAEAEAALLDMERQCRELGFEDPLHWQRVRGALDSVLMPRYAALARQELALAAADYHLWRGGDLVARLAFAGVGLLLGVAAVEIPWIPVTEKWVPWVLFLAGPFLPDAQLWFYRKRLERRLQSIVDDLTKADLALDAYRPLSELQLGLEAEPKAPVVDQVAPEKEIPMPAALRPRDRN
jgi:hypothetical protein